MFILWNFSKIERRPYKFLKSCILRFQRSSNLFMKLHGLKMTINLTYYWNLACSFTQLLHTILPLTGVKFLYFPKRRSKFWFSTPDEYSVITFIKLRSNFSVLHNISIFFKFLWIPRIILHTYQTKVWAKKNRTHSKILNFCPILKKLGQNDYLMRQSLCPSFIKIGQKLWIFYQWPIFERVLFFFAQTLVLIVPLSY